MQLHVHSDRGPKRSRPGPACRACSTSRRIDSLVPPRERLRHSGVQPLPDRCPKVMAWAGPIASPRPPPDRHRRRRQVRTPSHSGARSGSPTPRSTRLASPRGNPTRVQKPAPPARPAVRAPPLQTAARSPVRRPRRHYGGRRVLTWDRQQRPAARPSGAPTRTHRHGDRPSRRARPGGRARSAAPAVAAAAERPGLGSCAAPDLRVMARPSHHARCHPIMAGARAPPLDRLEAIGAGGQWWPGRHPAASSLLLATCQLTVGMRRSEFAARSLPRAALPAATATSSTARAGPPRRAP